MYADNLVLNYKFSIYLWTYPNALFVIYCNKFKLMYDSSIFINLENEKFSVSEIVDGDCFESTWRFFGVVLDFFDGGSHFTMVCGKEVSRRQSYFGLAFYDSPGKINLTTGSEERDFYNYNYVFRVIRVLGC